VAKDATSSRDDDPPANVEPVVLAMAIPSLLVTFLFVPHLARRSANAARRNRPLLETFGSEGEAALRRAAVAERPSVSTSSARAPRRSA
jgi:hypothetical protein